MPSVTRQGVAHLASVGRKVDFDEPEDAVDVNRPTAPGKVTAADVQPGDTVDGLRNVKGAHKVDAIRPDDSGAVEGSSRELGPVRSRRRAV